MTASVFRSPVFWFRLVSICVVVSVALGLARLTWRAVGWDDSRNSVWTPTALPPLGGPTTGNLAAILAYAPFGGGTAQGGLAVSSLGLILKGIVYRPSGVGSAALIAPGGGAVQTFVVPWDDTQLREAFQRELSCGGQVYFLHNDVESIGRMQRELEALVPEARIGIAHGQMPERELERVMLDFHKQRFNVLLCSTIIESGIDIPNANTIVINRADKFGLAQLHQLRGRVGRSHHRAYAYLVIPDGRTITADARKRLEAIVSMDELGAGFTLSTHDLEIRGAGELLGEDQSGQMAEIGFSLYTELLARAVQSIKQGKLPGVDPLGLDLYDHRGADVELHIPALIPDEYLPDVHTRLTLYKRVSSARNIDDLRELQVEMIDRFGLLPDPAKHLFITAELKLEATALGIRKLDLGATGGRIQFMEKPNVDPMSVIRLIQGQPKHYQMDGPDKLRIKLDLPDATARLQAARGLFAMLRSTP